MPSPVDKYFKSVKEKNPSYSDEQAWATAWSTTASTRTQGPRAVISQRKSTFEGRKPRLIRCLGVVI